jgi:hypothetical protein
MKQYITLLTRVVILNFICVLTLVLYYSKFSVRTSIRSEEVESKVPVATNTFQLPLDTNRPESSPTPYYVVISDEDLVINSALITNRMLTEVAPHDTQDDCWIVIDGHIYNITFYFGLHPGGDAGMALYCGKDGTRAYASKDKSPATDHSADSKRILTRFLVK